MKKLISTLFVIGLAILMSGCIEREQTPDYDLIAKKRKVNAKLAETVRRIDFRLADLDQTQLCNELSDIVYIGEQVQAAQDIHDEHTNLIEDSQPYKKVVAEYLGVLDKVTECQVAITGTISNMTDELVEGIQSLNSVKHTSTKTAEKALEYIAFLKRGYINKYLECCYSNMERLEIINAQNSLPALDRQAKEIVTIKQWLEDFPKPEFDFVKIEELKSKLDKLKANRSEGQ